MTITGVGAYSTRYETYSEASKAADKARIDALAVAETRLLAEHGVANDRYAAAATKAWSDYHAACEKALAALDA